MSVSFLLANTEKLTEKEEEIKICKCQRAICQNKQLLHFSTGSNVT